jgi:hypothetical protein
LAQFKGALSRAGSPPQPGPAAREAGSGEGAVDHAHGRGGVDLHVGCDAASHGCGQLGDAVVFDALRAAELASRRRTTQPRDRWSDLGTDQIEQLARAADRSASDDLPAP